MPLKIVRNDLIKMNTDAIVNTANIHVTVGDGCDFRVYEAAGRDELLAYREAHIGEVAYGEAFITPGFALGVKAIIHAVSPLYIDGNSGEEELLRSCYQKALKLAKDNKIKSISFPLIATGSFGYPKEEGLRIAIDEVNAFLLKNDMLVYLVVFDQESTKLGQNLYTDLESYVDENYVEEVKQKEVHTPRSSFLQGLFNRNDKKSESARKERNERESAHFDFSSRASATERNVVADKSIDAIPPISNQEPVGRYCMPSSPMPLSCASVAMPQKDVIADHEMDYCAEDFHSADLDRRMQHLSDTFSQYLLYLISEKGMTNAEVYKRAIVDKKVFSKIKNDASYHPQKITALCLCVGARLNLDETKDLLARAGYALSPCDKTDVIFSYFIEKEIYDMIELDIQLEEFGLPCLIS